MPFPGSARRFYEFLTRHPLAQRAPFRSALRILWWQAVARRMTDRRVDWIEGACLMARRGMTGATGNIYAGLHEPADMGLLLHLLRPGDLFVDGGANVGSYSILASKVCCAQSIAFEPGHAAGEGLLRNVLANGIEDLVDVRSLALGAEEGEVAFTTGNDTTNQIARPEAGNTRKVRMRTLDQELSGQNPTMIKLDLEGYETEALKGAGVTLANHVLKVLSIETVTDEDRNLLRDNGFEPVAYDPFTREFSPFDQALPYGNHLFIRDRTFVEARIRAAPRRTVAGLMI